MFVLMCVLPPLCYFCRLSFEIESSWVADSRPWRTSLELHGRASVWVNNLQVDGVLILLRSCESCRAVHNQLSLWSMHICRQWVWCWEEADSRCGEECWRRVSAAASYFWWMVSPRGKKGWLITTDRRGRQTSTLVLPATPTNTCVQPTRRPAGTQAER